MTYFQKPDHEYHRVMFEFTDTEMKDAGFEKLSLQPEQLEILRLLRRISDSNLNIKPISKPKSCLSLKLFSNGDCDLSIDDEIMPDYVPTGIKISNKDDDYRDLQRKKDAWKAKALRLIGFLNDKNNER